jgi:hypothetical protein
MADEPVRGRWSSSRVGGFALGDTCRFDATTVKAPTTCSMDGVSIIEES